MDEGSPESSGRCTLSESLEPWLVHPFGKGIRKGLAKGSKSDLLFPRKRMLRNRVEEVIRGLSSLLPSPDEGNQVTHINFDRPFSSFLPSSLPFLPLYISSHRFFPLLLPPFVGFAHALTPRKLTQPLTWTGGTKDIVRLSLLITPHLLFPLYCEAFLDAHSYYVFIQIMPQLLIQKQLIIMSENCLISPIQLKK